MLGRLLASLVLVSIGTLVLAADEPATESTPKFPETGSFIPGPFHVLNITGERKNSYHCLICRNAFNPVAAIFVRPEQSDDDKEKLTNWFKKLEPDQPLPTLMKKLDDIAHNYQDVHMGAFAVFMRKDTVKVPVKDKLEKLADSAGLRQLVLTVHPLTEEAAGPEGWNIDKNAEVTVFLYSKHKVLAHYVFTSDKPLEKKEDIDAIVAVYEKMVPFYAKGFERKKAKAPVKKE